MIGNIKIVGRLSERALLQSELAEKLKLKKGLEQDIRRIQNLLEKAKEQPLQIDLELTKRIGISAHAILRFKERCADLPTSRIVEILKRCDASFRYLQYGKGNYMLHKKSPIELVMDKNTVVTVINHKQKVTITPMEKLNLLSDYISYRIEEKYTKNSLNIMRFPTFVKYNWNPKF